MELLADSFVINKVLVDSSTGSDFIFMYNDPLNLIGAINKLSASAQWINISRFSPMDTYKPLQLIAFSDTPSMLEIFYIFFLYVLLEHLLHDIRFARNELK